MLQFLHIKYLPENVFSFFILGPFVPWYEEITRGTCTSVMLYMYKYIYHQSRYFTVVVKMFVLYNLSFPCTRVVNLSTSSGRVHKRFIVSYKRENVEYNLQYRYEV